MRLNTQPNRWTGGSRALAVGILQAPFPALAEAIDRLPPWEQRTVRKLVEEAAAVRREWDEGKR